MVVFKNKKPAKSSTETYALALVFDGLLHRRTAHLTNKCTVADGDRLSFWKVL